MTINGIIATIKITSDGTPEGTEIATINHDGSSAPLRAQRATIEIVPGELFVVARLEFIAELDIKAKPE